MEIVFKNRDFIVINKPPLVPSQSDPSGEADAMKLTAECLSELGEKNTLWLVHRLDRVVGGLLVFARRKEAAAELSALIQNGDFSKEYLAVAEGEAPGGEMQDFLYKDSVTNKAYAVKTERRGAKVARLSYMPIGVNNGKTLVNIKLETGRFHQIRAQFASRKMPLVGDKKYGSRDFVSRQPALFAHKISFKLFGEDYSFSAKPDLSLYPWNLFKEECYEEI